MTRQTRQTRQTRPGLRFLSIYVGMVALGAGALLVVLPAGNRIESAPQLSRVSRVAGEAVACLGDRLVAVQSGTFVDLHVPVSAEGEELGRRVARGRIDRDSGRATLDGMCAPGSDAAGRSFTSRMTFEGREVATVTGTVRVAGRDLDVTMVADDRTGVPSMASADEEPLAGSELVGRIFLSVALVILASRAVGLVFHRLRQPRVLGEIVAGILLGPSLVGAVWPDFTGYFFPAEVTDVLGVMAQFGLIFFMFLIGLELDLDMVRRSGRSAVLISHVSIVLPFALGLVAAIVIYPLLGSGDFTGFALFMGAAMAITAFPVLARILTETGIYRTRLGALSITCAAVDDVTAWCILAVVVAIVKSSGPADAVQTVALALGFVAFMLFVVRPLVSRWLSVSDGRGRLGAPVMASLIVGLFLAAWATEEIGIHAIFGAFMMGVAMPRSTGLVAEVTEKLEDVTVLFLLPIFFAVVGLSTRIGLVDQPALWGITALVIALAVAGKWGGSMFAGRALGESWRQANALGLLMNTRGLTEIVILTVGASLGVISPALFTIMVLMALVTTLMATPLLAVFYPRRLVQREMAKQAVEHERSHPRVPAGAYRVLVGVEDPSEAQGLTAVLTALRLRGAGGRRPDVVLATVAPLPGREEVRANLASLDDTAARARAELAPLAAGLLAAGFETRVRAEVASRPGEELVRMAEAEHADLLLVNRHRPFIGRDTLGGVVRDVLDRAPCDVAVLIDKDGMAPYDGGGVGTWFGVCRSDQAAFDLSAMLRSGRGPVRLLRAAGAPRPSGDIEAEEVTVASRTAAAVLDAASGISLLVLGSNDATDGSAFGEQRDAIIADANVPVLVVQRAAAGRTITNGASRPMISTEVVR